MLGAQEYLIRYANEFAEYFRLNSPECNQIRQHLGLEELAYLSTSQPVLRTKENQVIYKYITNCPTVMA